MGKHCGEKHPQEAPRRRYRFSDGDAKAPTLSGFPMNNELAHSSVGYLWSIKKRGCYNRGDSSMSPEESRG